MKDESSRERDLPLVHWPPAGGPHLGLLVPESAKNGNLSAFQEQNVALADALQFRLFFV